MLTGPMYEEALKFGLQGDRLFLIPYGVDTDRFSPMTQLLRAETRQKLGIPKDAKVILTVGALKREHKRIDYMIREISELDEKVWLLAASQVTEKLPLLKRKLSDTPGTLAIRNVVSL
jgi:glycosyltransferase involved in cell wall biosynthesis